MTAYADQAFAIALYGLDYVTVSCDRDGDGLDEDAFALALDVATDMINGYLLGKIPLPLATIPLALKKYCVDLAIYEMCPSASVRTEEKTKRYDAALAYLKGVRDNKLKLAAGDATAPEHAAGAHLTASPTVIPSEAQIYEVEAGSRDYTRDKLKGLL